MSYNKLLERQLQKMLPNMDLKKDDFQKFLQVVSDSYNSFERDKMLAERAFRISEEEFFEINEKLKKEVDNRNNSVLELKKSIGVFSEEDNDSNDLLTIAKFLTDQVAKRENAEKVYTNLITNLQSGILLEDETRHIVFANQLFCDIFGIPVPPELLKGVDCKNSAEDIKALFKNSETFVENINQILFNKELVIGEVFEMEDGRVLERTYIPIFVEENYKGHLWSYGDITERQKAEKALKMSEEKYRSIIANMNLGLVEVDKEEHIQFVNQSFMDMCGYQAEELIGRKASTLFANGENIKFIEGKVLLRDKGVSDAYEVPMKNKRGELRWWLISGAPRYDDNGELVGSIGIHLDITEQKKLQTELILAREEAENLAHAKERFLANMSHEIRTPMNAIMGMSHQLGKTPLTENQSFYLNTIHAASENLLVIINDILDMSKIEAGKLTMERIGFEPNEVVQKVMQVLHHKADEKGLNLTNSTCDNNMSPILIGDPYRLNQVLTNLISNSIKFTEKGIVDLSCKVIYDSNTNQTVEIKVSDTGIGMDEEFLKTLFEKFSQESLSISRKFGGTGLGMSICKELVSLMGGTIEVKSRKEFGTTVILKINFQKGEKSDLPTNDIVTQSPDILEGKIILVVDDNEMNRLIATTILHDYSAQTLEASNGRKALEVLRTETIDLILMDIQMPEMGGYEATEYIRNVLKLKTPIVALTANAIKGENEKCLSVGMNDYISKPFREDNFISIIARTLGKKVKSKGNFQVASDGKPLFKLNKLYEIFRGNEEFVKKMVNLFIEMAPSSIHEIKEAYEKKDLQKVKAVSHRLKPSIDNLEITTLAEIIRKLENIQEEHHQAEILILIGTLESQIETVVAHLKKYLKMN